MIRSLTFVLVASASGLCVGQTYKAEIAYTRFSGNSDYLYLANSDGTRAIKVYSAYKLRISGVDFAPGGGRIAITDTGGSLWVLPYTKSNDGIFPGTPLRLDGPDREHGAAGRPDFSADGSRILYIYNRPKTEIRSVAAAGGETPTVLLEGSEADSIKLENPRWLRAGAPGDFVYTQHTFLPSYSAQLRVGFLEPGGVTTATEFTMGVSGGPCYDWLDTARTRHSVLLQACSTSGVSAGLVEYDLIGRQVTATYNVAPGSVAYDGHFSPDDSQIVHGRLVQMPSPESVYRFTIQGQQRLKITKSGLFGVTDWQP